MAAEIKKLMEDIEGKNYVKNIRHLIVVKTPNGADTWNFVKEKAKRKSHRYFGSNLPDYSGNFDLEMRLNVYGTALWWWGVIPYGYQWDIRTEFIVLMNLMREETPESIKCCDEGGELKHLVPQMDGNEAFCVCKKNFIRDDCSLYVSPTSDHDEIFELDVLKDIDLRVPGMFDLRNEIIQSAEKVLNRIVEAENRLTEVITQDGDKTRQLITESTTKQMNYVNNKISELQSHLGMKLGGFRNDVMKGLLRQQLATREGTTLIMNEIGKQFGKMEGSLRLLHCTVQKQNLYPQLKNLEELIQHWKDISQVSVDKEKEFFHSLHLNYIYFRDEQLPSLIDAMNGRNDGIVIGKSLIGK